MRAFFCAGFIFGTAFGAFLIHVTSPVQKPCDKIHGRPTNITIRAWHDVPIGKLNTVELRSESLVEYYVFTNGWEPIQTHTFDIKVLNRVLGK